MSNKIKRPAKLKRGEPAKGGTKSAHKNAYTSGDSPKPQGDPMRHLIEKKK
jgi:hypothetical protein